jgi:hypothetical protein
MPAKRHIAISSADQAITRCFTHMLEAAAGGELDYWLEDPR